MKPWNKAVVPPPSTFPNAMDEQGIGATIISFKKPNCLSHIMEMAENMAVNSTVMLTMPGYIKVMYLVCPPPNKLKADYNPVPRMKRYING